MSGRTRIAIGSAALALVVAAASAHAAPAPKQFIALLNGGQETPPTTSTGIGVAHLTLDETTRMLCLTMTYQGLTGTEVAAHIHGPALPGVPAGVLFDLAADVAPPANPRTQCVGPLSKTSRNHLLKNQTYLNVHTTAVMTGEIRGQIMRIK
jgi:hypothetical protein